MNISETHILVKALAATRSAVTITDNRLPDNPIVYCNDAFLELTGYEKSEVIGSNCRFLQGNDTNARSVYKIRTAIKNDRDSHVILKNYTKRGRMFWNDLQISPVYDETGKLTHFIGLQSDVTVKIEKEQASAEAKRLLMQNEMLELEKQQLTRLNEAKDDFISVASHQLRTPATAVKQYLGMLEDGIYGSLTKEQSKAISTAYESNDRQLRIIDKLLQIARIDAGKIVLSTEDIDVSKLLEDIQKEFEYRLIDRKQTIRYTGTNPHIHMRVDKHLLRTVFENLIDNSMKYSHTGTIIDISVEEFPASTVISISDQGIGMSKGSLDKLFEKFTRIENPKTRDIGGTGLGLYWVKKVLDLHHAQIKMKSEEGKGTTFELHFPAHGKS